MFDRQASHIISTYFAPRGHKRMYQLHIWKSLYQLLLAIHISNWEGYIVQQK